MNFLLQKKKELLKIKKVLFNLQLRFLLGVFSK